MTTAGDYAASISALELLGIMPKGMPKLDPMRRALERSGALRRADSERAIVIAGTNGKGTVAATLSRLLTDAGGRPGLYTSPHLVTTRERIRVAEADLPAEAFVAAHRALEPVIREEGLTHFEALTLIAAAVFHSGDFGPPVDWAVWEVGLGGLFDATNAVPHRFCALTRIGLDHQAILGATVEEIAVQKLGIVSPGAIAVYTPAGGAWDGPLAGLRDETARRTGCRWVRAPECPRRGTEILTPWGGAELALAGDRAAENTALALALFAELGFDPGRHLGALREVRWPGRFSPVAVPGLACPAFVSGDHNVDGVGSLAGILAEREAERPWRRLRLLVGLGADKDAAGMLARLSALPRASLYLTETPFKPLPLADYPDDARARAAFAHADPFQALERLVADAGSDDLVVVTGSLYLVGAVLGRFGR